MIAILVQIMKVIEVFSCLKGNNTSAPLTTVIKRSIQGESFRTEGGRKKTGGREDVLVTLLTRLKWRRADCWHSMLSIYCKHGLCSFPFLWNSQDQASATRSRYALVPHSRARCKEVPELQSWQMTAGHEGQSGPSDQQTEDSEPSVAPSSGAHQDGA